MKKKKLNKEEVNQTEEKTQKKNLRTKRSKTVKAKEKEKENNEQQSNNISLDENEEEKKIQKQIINIPKDELKDLLNDALIIDKNQTDIPKVETPQNLINNFPLMPIMNPINNYVIQLCDRVPEDKFINYSKECIKNIKKWSPFGKNYLKAILDRIKSINIFSYRNSLKEPFKTLITDYILFILSHEGKLKDENEDEIPCNLTLCPEDQFKKTTIQEQEFLKHKKKREIEESQKKLEEAKKNEKSKDKKKDKTKKNEKTNDEEKIELDRDDICIIELINNIIRNKGTIELVELTSKSPITRREMVDYMNKKCLLSCFSKLFLDVTSKNFAEKSLATEITSFLCNPKNKIYFVEMNEQLYSFTLYDGTIFLNKNMYDLMVSDKKERNLFGKAKILLTMFHEMTYMLSTRVMGRIKYLSFFKCRRDCIEEVGEYLEELLLGRKKRHRYSKGNKIAFTTVNLLPIKNIRYINNLKNYELNYNRFRNAFVKLHKTNPIGGKDKEYVEYMKYYKNNINSILSKNTSEFFFPFRRKMN